MLGLTLSPLLTLPFSPTITDLDPTHPIYPGAFVITVKPAGIPHIINGVMVIATLSVATDVTVCRTLELINP